MVFCYKQHISSAEIRTKKGTGVTSANWDDMRGNIDISSHTHSSTTSVVISYFKHVLPSNGQ